MEKQQIQWLCPEPSAQNILLSAFYITAIHVLCLLWIVCSHQKLKYFVFWQAKHFQLSLYCFSRGLSGSPLFPHCNCCGYLNTTNHIWFKLFLYLLPKTHRPTFTAVTLRAAWPIHHMMTMQFTKLQASWNPALKKPQTLLELLIDYWWRPDKCTRLTIPMTFLSPALGHLCCSACLYISVSWYKS